MRAPLTPPSDERELAQRARFIAGRTVGELAALLEVPLPLDETRAKGFVGGLVERALGASAGSRAEPDFPSLGVELKTIPLDREGRPRESTFVCSIPLPTLADLDFDASPLGRKLARILFVPVEPALRPLAERRIGGGLFWSPDATERATLEADYDLLAAMIADGELDRVTAHLGEALQVRPKAATSRVRRVGPSSDGAIEHTLPRGFYLRARFTERALARVRRTPG